MAFANSAKNAALDGIGVVAVRMSLHSADPGTTGASEIAGGGYARQTCVWSAASVGSMALAGNEVFSVEAGDTVAWAGLFRVDDTTFLLGIDLPDETFGIAGTYTVTTATTLTA